MFLQGWAISDVLRNNGGFQNANIALFSRRFTYAGANPMMEFCFFQQNRLAWTDDLLSGQQTTVSSGNTFLHNRSFFIDDFATPGNSHLALKIVYVSAGFWESGPFLSTTESRISQNRLAWKIVERFEPFRSLRNRWTIENRSTIWKNRWTIWKKYYRESLDICEIVERLPICKSLDIGFKSLKSLDIC